MVCKKRTTKAILFTLLFAAMTLVITPIDSAWAKAGDDDSANKVDKKEVYAEQSDYDENDEGRGVHADPATFEKNFCLSVDQKKYTITEIEKVVENHTSPEMSDLEKYYVLAKWVNQHVVYDSEFWSGAYNMEYYSHQWDAYGAINENEKSVCAGIAIFYSNVCHAADLPCKFVRLNPQSLDHTITYIPDINGHAYYADITENDFLMSDKACVFAESVDKAFAGISEDETPVDGTFEYESEGSDDEDSEVSDEDESCHGTDIKECWQEKVTYGDWFKEYALHEDTDKVFKTDYIELGSGESGQHYASYKDYPAQPYESREKYGDGGATTGIWFLDDFYKYPAEAAGQILNKEMDEQFLNISGVKGNYDCEDTNGLVEAVKQDLSVEYFPSVEDGQIVAKAVGLTEGADYDVEYSGHDEETGEEVLLIKGKGDYTNICELRVRMNSAIAKKAPTRINGLVYDGSKKNLAEPGVPENGKMLYAVCKEGEEPGNYSEAIPAATDAGKYDVWYKVKGRAGHSDLPPQKLEIPVKIAAQDISEEKTVNFSKTSFSYNGKIQKPSISIDGMEEGTDYTVEWNDPSAKNPGTYGVDVSGIGNYTGTIWNTYTIKKAANPMKLKAKTAKVKSGKIKKKAQTIKRAKAITVSKAEGAVSYKLVSAKKGKKNFKKKFKINAKTGNVTVKKGLKKGTYKVKVKVKAAGSANYNASAWKKVTFKVRVK